MSTSNNAKSRKLQRLKNQLYISDNSDIEDIIDNNDNNNNNNGNNNGNIKNNIDFIPNQDNTTIRHTRKRQRIDYNENKRVPLYTIVQATPFISNTPNTPPATSMTSVEFTENNSNNTLNLNRTKSSPQSSQNSSRKSTPFEFEIELEKPSSQIETNFIDTRFLRRIVESDLNKKLSVLGNSDIIVHTRNGVDTRTETNSYNNNNVDDNYLENENDDSYIDYNDTVTAKNIENQNLSHSLTDEFTDTINNEIKNKYERLSHSIVTDKQRKIYSTVNAIDEEINAIGEKYAKFKQNIINNRSRVGKNTSLDNSKVYAKTVKPMNYKPSMYPGIFMEKVKRIQKDIHVESKLMTYSLINNELSKSRNVEAIKRRYITSFNENRESMKKFLRMKIDELDDELQHRVGGTDIIALANVADISSVVDWTETNRLVKEAERRIQDSDNDNQQE